tara:strand:+ start:440 stop:1024 length:585 start_codon:yes stop_codon:yes gene_type:complete
MSSFPDTATEILPLLSSSPDGLSSEDSIQMLLNQMARTAQAKYTSEKLPRVGIVRRVKEIDDLSQINSISAKDRVVFGRAQTVYAVNIEIRNLTETYESLVAETINVELSDNEKDNLKEQFYNSMPEVIVDPAIVKDRVPKEHEVVLLGYDVPNEFLSVKLAGFPFNKPFLDPNLNSYSVGKKQTAKKAYPSGA